MLTWLVNPHVKEKIEFQRFYEPLLGPAEVSRRKAIDHKAIMRDRRRKRKR